MVRTPGFHPGNGSSILPGITSILAIARIFSLSDSDKTKIESNEESSGEAFRGPSVRELISH